MACQKLKTFAGGMRRINPAGMIFHCCCGELSANAASAHRKPACVPGDETGFLFSVYFGLISRVFLPKSLWRISLESFIVFLLIIYKVRITISVTHLKSIN